jgi:hypothetical protein
MVRSLSPVTKAALSPIDNLPWNNHVNLSTRARMSSAEEETIGTEVAPSDESLVSLVEIEPGMAVLFADKPPVDFDLIPFEMLSTQARQNLGDKLAIAPGIGNLAAQGAQGAISAQGLVRFVNGLPALEVIGA